MPDKIHYAGSGETGNQGLQYLYMFYCPGCKNNHGFHVPFWRWNGSLTSPTFSPSLMCNRDDPKSRCHCNVTDGKIHFHADCWHGLAGQVVDMEDWE